MRYWIANDDSVQVVSEGGAAPADAVLVFSNLEELQAGVSRWAMRRLVNVWNQLPASAPVRRFENRQVATERLWRAIEDKQQQLPHAGDSPPQTKTERIISLLQEPRGVTMEALMAATHWQAHSVRGFLSGKLRKERGLTVHSFMREGERVYSLQGCELETRNTGGV